MTTQLTISESIRNSLNKEYGKKFKKLTRASKLLMKVTELKNDARLNEVSESLAKLDSIMSDTIAFFLMESVRYPLANYAIIQAHKQADSDYLELLRNRYSVGQLVLFSDMPVESADSFSKVNVRFYVTSHDYESQTFAGNADVFSKSGELLSKRVMVLKYKADKYFIRSYFDESGKGKYLVKPETKVIPPLAFIIESFVPTKKGMRPKAIKVMNYWHNLLDCELALYEREHKAKQTRLSFTNFVLESRSESPKTRTMPAKFKHIVERTESNFEILSIGAIMVDMSKRIDSDTRKETSELPKSVRSLFSFVSQLVPTANESQLSEAKKQLQTLAKKNRFMLASVIYNVQLGNETVKIQHNPPTKIKLAKLQ